MYTDIYIYTQTQINAHTHIRTHTQISNHTHTYRYTHTHTQIRNHTHRHTYFKMTISYYDYEMVHLSGLARALSFPRRLDEVTADGRVVHYRLDN